MIPENHFPARKTKYEDGYFLFVSSDSVLDEETGETFPRSELHNWILRWDGSSRFIVACNNASAIVKELDEKLSAIPSWNWRATPLRRVKRSAIQPRDSKPAVSVHLVPHYCGFKRSNGKSRNRYLHFADCPTLTGHTSDAIYPDLCSEESLRTWGTSYRQLCRDNGLQVCSTRGKFGGAMLRDPRFTDGSRRRVPSFINEIGRSNLPGNYYELRTDEGVIKDGLYLDITSAYHNAAKTVQFPNPAGLRARGNSRSFTEESPIGGKLWAPAGSNKYDSVRRTYGLVLVRASFRGLSKGTIVHPDARTANVGSGNLLAVYTNELPLLEKSGFTIEGFEAAITSGRTDPFFKQYADSATQTLQGAPKEDRAWMKQLFLSTYGMLAKKPTKYQSVSNLGMTGRSITWPTSSGWIEGSLKQGTKSHSPVTTNTIALGMIQADIRRNVIELARYLQTLQVNVLALYADSLIVDASSALPFLPPEWRVKTELTNLRFLNSVSWVADEEERLPGIGRDTALRESRRRAVASRAYERYGVHREETRSVRPPEWVLGLAEVVGVEAIPH